MLHFSLLGGMRDAAFKSVQEGKKMLHFSLIGA